MPSRRQILRSSLVVGVFSLLGSLTGILVETSIAARLSLSRSSDTFYVAFTAPYLIVNVLSATGQSYLVPFFSTLDARHSAGTVAGLQLRGQHALPRLERHRGRGGSRGAVGDSR